MASRKDLKKNISGIVTELMTECIVRGKYINNVPEDKVNAILAELIDINSDFISRVSHTEPGRAAAYYKALYSSFNEKIGSVIDRIDSLTQK